MSPRPRAHQVGSVEVRRPLLSPEAPLGSDFQGGPLSGRWAEEGGGVLPAEGGSVWGEVVSQQALHPGSHGDLSRRCTERLKLERGQVVTV